MSGRIGRCSSFERTEITEGWQMLGAPPGEIGSPSALAQSLIPWIGASVPGTVASSLRAAGQWSLTSPARDFDAEEWWYRVTFKSAPKAPGEILVLGFDGLATLSEVWLNGSLILSSANMFLEHRCEVSDRLLAENTLILRFAALGEHLKQRRARPRWRTPMVSQQNLRWVRTTLLGRTPGWSPPAAAVGPWRAVWLERRRLLQFGELQLQASLSGELGGVLAVSCPIQGIEGTRITSARLVLERGDSVHEAALEVASDGQRVHGSLLLPEVDRWWPHTHGEAALYHARLEVLVHNGAQGSERLVEVSLGSVGFRSVELKRQDGDFALTVNGVGVFCRGACWTPLDVVSLAGCEDALSEAIDQVRLAGMNMLRIAGPMVYESDAFLDLCDARGILVWQDFMFASMDYPGEDAEFLKLAREEARQQLSRLQGRPALAMLCGNSEVAQQAAMCGAPRERWAPPLFEIEMAALAQEYCPLVPYCPSSTHGGAFPHQSSAGVSSYYGVGAYLLPPSDARRSQLRFASECLGFANVPEPETLELIAPGGKLRCHQPEWKAGVPRDLGAGWDFDDVRDHYLHALFRLDPTMLRSADHDRYLSLSRAASGEVMGASFAEWRGAHSKCRGALVWFLRDLIPGAGWGVIDSGGLPKAAYYYLKRALKPMALMISDEGTNGLYIHLVNDGPQARSARLELRCWRHSEPVGQPASMQVTLEARSATALSATDLFEGWLDLSYAYRFGPPAYELLVASLHGEEDAALLGEAFYFPGGLPNRQEGSLGLTATLEANGSSQYSLHVSTQKFAQSVHIAMPGFIAEDQYFHLSPKSSRSLRLALRRGAAAPRLEGTVHALNGSSPSRIRVAA